MIQIIKLIVSSLTKIFRNWSENFPLINTLLTLITFSLASLFATSADSANYGLLKITDVIFTKMTWRNVQRQKNLFSSVLALYALTKILDSLGKIIHALQIPSCLISLRKLMGSKNFYQNVFL